MNTAAVGGRGVEQREAGEKGGHLRLGGEQVSQGQALAVSFPGSGSQSSTFCGEN